MFLPIFRYKIHRICFPEKIKSLTTEYRRVLNFGQIFKSPIFIIRNQSLGEKMKKWQLIFITILLSVNISNAQNEKVTGMKDGWRFTADDDMKFARPDYDISGWGKINTGQTWESQGFEELDGFAWYRVNVFIPSSLKNNSSLKDSVKIFLGKIDDYDQSFLNGELFGVNGRNSNTGQAIDNSFMKEEPIPWNKNRFYTLPADDPRIMWDKENVIAVRVYDQGGAGGMFSGIPSIKMVDLSDYLKCDNAGSPFNFKNSEIGKSFSLRNISALYTIKGKFIIKAESKLNGKILFEKSADIELKPESTKNFSYLFNGKNQPSRIEYIFRYDNSDDESVFSDEAPYILTPAISKKPKINGAKVYGQRPGKPFLFTIAATGERPLTFKAINLPAGLRIDGKTGIITGSLSEEGIYKIKLKAENKFGSAESDLKIYIGDKIALTPPMGWNSWNVWGLTVDQEKVLASAKVYKQKGLLNHGWTYINIDDGWEIVGDSPLPKRTPDGNIICNSKFPDMKALGDSIHALGLKFGIYSSPGPLTCGGYTASYQHEVNDAQSYSNWGIDYLKYDWCSYGAIAKDNSIPELMKPYLVMRDALRNIDRDIVFSLCQYGMGKVWEWGNKVDGNLWRTTGDITDTWQSLSEIGFSQVENANYAGPGNWNDPDMLVVGWVGWGPNLHPTRLTPDEQYTHISLWSLLSAPLLIGCDLTRLDEFTLNLLTNDEVIALDQDPLGKQATPKIIKGNIQYWIKELEDGQKAIGIFNLGSGTEKVELNFSEAGIDSKIKLRDLWRQKELGTFSKKFETVVPSHGVVLIKTTK